MKTTFAIEGMHCQGCVKRLTAAFQAVPGVTAAHVTLAPPEAHIESDAPPSLDALSQAARNAGTYTVRPSVTAQPVPATPHDHAEHTSTAQRPASLYPLGLIVSFIAGTTALATFVRGDGSWHSLMLDFMAGFFLVFSFFKLLDLRGFVDAYQSYDIVARRSRAYGFVYPFIELALGIAYLIRWQPTITNSVTLAIMLIGSVGVLRAVLDKRAIRCACLGTALNLPMTTVTIVEDLGMAGMAAAALLWPH